MFRRSAIGVLLLTSLLAIPATADAGWLGYLARLSGPGPFGAYWAFRFQVVCFMESSTSEASIAQKDAALLLTDPVTTGLLLPPSFANARKAISGPSLDFMQQHAEDMARELDALIIQNPTTVGLRLAREAWRAAADSRALRDAPRTVIAPGAVVNASCADLPGRKIPDTAVLKPRKDRRAWGAIVVDYRHMRALEPNPDYAGNAQIHLDTVIPRFSWRVISNPTYDMLDIQAGAGVAVFHSDGFDTFSKLIIQPIRYEVRVPTRFTNSDGPWARLLSVPSYGAGITMFPSGFSAEDFNGTGAGARSISGKEGVFEQSLVLNFGRLLGW